MDNREKDVSYVAVSRHPCSKVLRHLCDSVTDVMLSLHLLGTEDSSLSYSTCSTAREIIKSLWAASFLKLSQRSGANSYQMVMFREN